MGLVKFDWNELGNFSLSEWQQAKRAQGDAKDTKIKFQDAWAVPESKVAFQAALKSAV